MSDTESARTGYTKLYHPRGPLVSMPVIGDTPKAMFDWVTAMLDAGFLVTAPGLEEGEIKEDVGWVARSTHEGRTGLADVIAYYSTNEGWTKPFLTDYLNNDEDRREFSAATGVVVASIPEYIGEGRLERGKHPKTDALIIKLPRPKTLIMKPNPKWVQTEFDAAIASGKVYKVPKRVFVRWADAPTVNGVPANLPHAEPLSEVAVAEAAWRARLATVISKDDMNKLLPMVKAITDEPIRKRAWTMCMEFAESKKWFLDVAAKMFKDVAEVPAPPAEAPKSAPPPPDEPELHPLIAEWQKRLDANTVNLDKMNGEILTAFKNVIKSNPLRNDVWGMIRKFAVENGCEWDDKTYKFYEVAVAGVPDYPG